MSVKFHQLLPGVTAIERGWLNCNQIVLRANSTIDVGPAGADGFWELPAATPMFMCPSPVNIRVIDEAIRFEITLTDANNATVAHGQTTLVPRCPTSPPETFAFCQMICVG